MKMPTFFELTHIFSDKIRHYWLWPNSAQDLMVDVYNAGLTWWSDTQKY